MTFKIKNITLIGIQLKKIKDKTLENLTKVL